MSALVQTFDVEVSQTENYNFRVHFEEDVRTDLRVDESSAMEPNQHPDATHLLAAAVGNCLAASLVYCMQRSGVELQGVRARVKTDLVRNDERHLRVGEMRVDLEVPLGEGEATKLVGSRELFEEFCTVTQSVRNGIPITVGLQVSEMRPALSGAVLEVNAPAHMANDS